MNGIQEVSGSIPLISTNSQGYAKALKTQCFQGFCFSLSLGTALQNLFPQSKAHKKCAQTAGNRDAKPLNTPERRVYQMANIRENKRDGKLVFLPLHGLSWTGREQQTDKAVHHLGSPGRSNPGKSKEGRRAGGGCLGAGDTGRVSKGERTGTGVHPPAREAAGQLHSLCQ